MNGYILKDFMSQAQHDYRTPSLRFAYIFPNSIFILNFNNPIM